MRPFEIGLPILLIAYTLWPVLSGRRRPVYVSGLAPLALVVTVLHLALEGYRWQMLPLYLLVLGACLAAALATRRPGSAVFRRRSWRGIGLIGMTVLVAAATALPVLLPVPRLPAPSGRYAVGTVTVELVDTTREEIYSGRANEPRRFLIQIWYPAVPEPGARPAPWMENARIVGPAIAEWLHLPRFFLDHLALARTASFTGAPMDRSGAPYPVLVFSHGWGGFRAQNTYQMQELASHGYVVVGMEHTYGAVVTVFADGQVAANNPAALPDGVPDAEYEAAARRLVQQWIGDMAFTLDTLETWNRADPEGRFEEMLSLTSIGVLGHSTGGAAAIEFCANDPRCSGGVAMDAWMTPVTEETLARGLTKPFLFLFSELWPTEKNQALFDRLQQHSNSGDQVVTILGADHYDFSDLPALTPLAPQLGLKGPIQGARVQTIVNAYSLAFFNQLLNGQATTLLDGPSAAYPEVRFDR